MTRNYKRVNPGRVVLSSKLFNIAKELVENGASTRFAAKVIGASVSCLRNRLHVGEAAERLGRSSLFCKEQERDFVTRCKRIEGSGLRRIDLRRMAYVYATVNDIPNKFDKSTQIAGRDWLMGFLKRHPEIVPVKQRPGETGSEFSDQLEKFRQELQVSREIREAKRKATRNATRVVFRKTTRGEIKKVTVMSLSKLTSMATSDATRDATDVGCETHLEDNDIDIMGCEKTNKLEDHREDPIKLKLECERLAEFQADEELEFGSRAKHQSPSRSSQQRVAASAPPPLPQNAHPMFWPEEPQPIVKPGPSADEYQIFGDFVASELRTLRSEESRKRLKRIIQKAILKIGEEEDVNIING